MRAVVYDAAGLGGLSNIARASLTLARHFAVDRARDSRFVQFDDRGFSETTLAHLPQALNLRPAAPEPQTDAAFTAVRSWLVGAAGPQPGRRRRAIMDSIRAPTFNRTKKVLDAPSGALLIRFGLDGWARSSLESWLGSRPDVVSVAILTEPWQVQRPEYATPSVASRSLANFDALLRHAHAIIAPNAGTAAWLAQEARARGSQAFVDVAPQPSLIAESRAWAHDPELAAAPYLLIAGPINARANILLILQIWRELASLGKGPPKLVLAGRRGAQIDQIAPMLDWAEAIKPWIMEAPNLSSSGLRQLIAHARALIAPAFVDSDGALVRDAARLGAPTLASDIPIYRRAGAPRAVFIDPLDGLRWRDAIAAAAASAPRRVEADASLLTWADWRRNVSSLIDAL